jgi:hypothetical protein
VAANLESTKNSLPQPSSQSRSVQGTGHTLSIEVRVR